MIFKLKNYIMKIIILFAIITYSILTLNIIIIMSINYKNLIISNNIFIIFLE